MAIIQVALARNAENAQRVLIEFSCLSSVAINDLVYMDSSNPETVITATGHTHLNQIIGVVFSKPQTTIARVLVLGLASGFSSFTVGGRVFLSETGVPTTTRPTTSPGYLHNLGVAVSSTDFLFIPNNIRVKLA